MTTLAILPIKSFDEAKQRLRDGAWTHAPRARSSRRCSPTCWSRCAGPRWSNRCSSSPADHGAQRIAGGYGAMVVEDEEHGHNEAAARGIGTGARARRRPGAAGPRRLPAAGPGRARRADRAAAPTRASVLIVPDRHGTGTNALAAHPARCARAGVRPGQPRASRAERRRRRHRRRDRRRSHRWRSTSTPPRTWPRSRRRWSRRRGGAAHTRGMLRQLRRAAGG